mmetsp:Transcript_23468/g.72186  ORF Transcript_23468/g.72186 Transcript_23468/m.72186 type:complete len:235 (-) Transcript_23468:96-800(-)
MGNFSAGAASRSKSRGSSKKTTSVVAPRTAWLPWREYLDHCKAKWALKAPQRTAQSPGHSAAPSGHSRFGAPLYTKTQSRTSSSDSSKSSGERSLPSMMRSAGSGTPATARIVEKTSAVLTRLAETRGAIFPGQWTTPGTRTPPSQVVVLPSKKGPAEPAASPCASHGPLSDEKNVRTFWLSYALVTSPRAQSISISASPKRPRFVALQKRGDTKSGTWTCENAKYKANGLVVV